MAEVLTNVVSIFQGQGTQEVGMGRDLYAQNAEVRKLYLTAEQVLGYSVLDLTKEELDQTRYVQPAIFVYSEACRIVLESSKKLSPKFYAGSSLGQYNALLAAGAFSFEDGLSLVRARGEGMQIACEQNPGGLLALLIRTSGDEPPSLRQLGYFATAATTLMEEVDLYLEANNSDTQVVIGGLNNDLRDAQIKFKEMNYAESGLSLIPLKVAGAFHTPLMEPAVPYLMDALDAVTLRRVRVPVIANTTAKPIREPEEIRQELIDHLTMPVLWKETIDYIEQSGVSATLEFGKKNLLSKMMGHRGKIAAATIGGIAGVALGVATFLYFHSRQDNPKN